MRGGLRLTVLVARERVNAATEDFSGLALIEVQLLSYPLDVGRVNIRSIHLALELADQIAIAIAVLGFQNHFAARGAKITR